MCSATQFKCLCIDLWGGVIKYSLYFEIVGEKLFTLHNSTSTNRLACWTIRVKQRFFAREYIKICITIENTFCHLRCPLVHTDKLNVVVGEITNLTKQSANKKGVTASNRCGACTTVKILTKVDKSARKYTKRDSAEVSADVCGGSRWWGKPQIPSGMKINKRECTSFTKMFNTCSPMSARAWRKNFKTLCKQIRANSSKIISITSFRWMRKKIFCFVIKSDKMVLNDIHRCYKSKVEINTTIRLVGNSPNQSAQREQRTKCCQ